MPRYRVMVEHVMQYDLDAEDEAEVRAIVAEGAVEDYVRATGGRGELYDGPTLLSLRRLDPPG